MSKKPPIRPGITFEVGARIEAQDYLQKWYPSKIEKIDYEEEKMLVHFERWSSRYDEWIHWDSSRIRPFEKPAIRKEGPRDDEEEIVDFREGEEVLARWTDCRYYPAKIEAINKEGTYTVQFYDGVIRCLKKMHIKSMPEDAKGQDWIALVKAAAAVAKNKSANKPRTSVNSNKDIKEEKKLQKASLKKEDAPSSNPPELLHKEEEPTSSSNLEIALEELPKLPLQPRDDEALLKRKISQASSFQAKRARLNKITGLLASKAVVLEDAEKKQKATEKPANQEEAITPKPPSPIEADICHSGTTVKPLLLPPSLSSGKSRYKKDKQDPVDASACRTSPPLSIIDPQRNQGSQISANLSRSSGRNNQRRRSRRHTSDPPAVPLHIPFREEKGLSYIQTPQDLSIAKVPAVAFEPQEKLEPLDLSRNVDVTSPITPAATYHIDCPTKEKEHLQLITYSPKAIADGRIASTSAAPESHPLSLLTALALPNNLKPPKGSKKKKSSALPSTETTETSSPAAENKLPDSVQEKIIKKVNDKDKQPEVGAVKTEKKVKTEDKASSAGKKKEKDKERKEKKEKDHSKSKQKKKKKKKKKKHSDYEGASLEFLDRSVSPVILPAAGSVPPNNTLTVKNTTFQFPCAILSVDLTGENLSNMEFLDDSSTESLILSGDEYNQEFDSTNFEESQDEEEGAASEIVRCVCQMDEENGFMIQCEECLCWQHSVCMGLLEDSIPEQYICYVCSDPPGQRWSARYKYDRDWFNNGRMCGLSFINENYSYLNTKKIVSTHHLLADVYGVTQILHGLQLKFGVLKNKDHPDLRLWSLQGKGTRGQNHKGPANKLGKTDETYITNEHSYQKPQDSGGDSKAPNDIGKSEDNSSGLVDGQKSNLHTEPKRRLSDHVNMERRCEQAVSAAVCNDKKVAEEQLDTRLQWQLNLLTHIENVQNEVTSRMDLIEKEVDVLESWLDFTGDLEPPDPLARLPQLKRRIKQLLIDMGKIQQITTLCSV